MKTRVPVKASQVLSPVEKRNRHDDWEHCDGKLDHVDSNPALGLRDVEDPVAECEAELEKYVSGCCKYFLISKRTYSVLQDGGDNHDLSGNGLEAVDSIRNGDGGHRSDAQTGETISTDQDRWPWPLILRTNSANDVEDDGDDGEWDERRETELGLTNAVVAESEALGHVIGKRASSRDTDETTDEEGKVGVSYLRWVPAVWWSAEKGALVEVEDQENIGWTRKHESCPEDDGVAEDLDRVEEAGEEVLLPAAVHALVQVELAAGWLAFADEEGESCAVAALGVGIRDSAWRLDALFALALGLLETFCGQGCGSSLWKLAFKVAGLWEAEDDEQRNKSRKSS